MTNSSKRASAGFILLVALAALAGCGFRYQDHIPRSTACERSYLLNDRAEDAGLYIWQGARTLAESHCDRELKAADDVLPNRFYPDRREDPRICDGLSGSPSSDPDVQMREVRCVADWADFVEFALDRPESCIEPLNMQNRGEDTGSDRFRQLSEACERDRAEPSGFETFVGGCGFLAAAVLFLVIFFRGAFSD